MKQLTEEETGKLVEELDAVVQVLGGLGDILDGVEWDPLSQGELYVVREAVGSLNDRLFELARSIDQDPGTGEECRMFFGQDRVLKAAEAEG